MDYERVRVITDVGTRSRTKQANAQETDINLMVARYRKTGVFPHVNQRIPQYGDFSMAVSLEEAYQVVADAQQAFDSLPAAVRALAQNDPIMLLEMLADEGARKALIEVGLPMKETDTPSGGENPTRNEAGGPSGGGVS